MDRKLIFKYLFIAVFVLINSCSNTGLPSVSKPNNLLNRVQMAGILADMHLADAGLQARNLSPDSLRRSNAGYNDFIFTKHKTTLKDFEASYDYYLSIPMEMDSVYMQVVDLLNTKDAKSRGISVGSTILSDSISK